MIYKNVSEIYEQYDSFFIDVYGVIYNGIDIFDGVLDLMKEMKESGKNMIILSNSTLVSEECQERYSKRGLMSGAHYDKFVSSGEVFCECCKEYLSGAKTFYAAFNRNERLFSRLNLIESKSIENADFVYIGSLNNREKSYTVDDAKLKSGESIAIEDIIHTDCRDIEGFEPIAELLEKCQKLNKPFVVADPDIFVIERVEQNGVLSRRPVLCQGGVGEFYERVGGKVFCFGKPYQPVYDFAKRFLNGSQKTAMIGDTLWTDILGANGAGIDSILVLTGVSGQFLKEIPEGDINQKLKILSSGISKKMTHNRFASVSQNPTFIAQSFA